MIELFWCFITRNNVNCGKKLPGNLQITVTGSLEVVVESITVTVLVLVLVLVGTAIWKMQVNMSEPLKTC